MLTLRAALTATALLAAALVSANHTASAQTTRISRLDTGSNNPNRGLPSGALDNPADLGNPGLNPARRNVDYSAVDRRTLSNLVREAWDESGKLYTALDADYRRNPQLRSLLTDLSRLRTLTGRLSQNLATGTDLSLLVEDFRQTDADWRIFSHRMSQARGLSTSTTQSLQRIDRLDREMGKLFQVAPSLDRRSLLQQLSSLENSLFNLADELQRDINTPPQLITSTRKLQTQVARINSMVVDDYAYERIVSEYNRFDQAWTQLMPQITSIRNSYVERTVQRFTAANYTVHELLWMDTTTSRAQLKQSAESLIQDVDEFYKRTSLLLLLNFKNANQTLQVASDFYGTIQNFRDNLERNESDAQLVDSFRYIEEQGEDFLQTFRQMKSQAAIVVLQEIEDGIDSLRRELNLGSSGSTVDNSRLQPVAASLEDLADQLDLDIRQWLNSERPAWRNEAAAASTAFVKRAQRIHRLVDNNSRLPELQRDVDGLFTDWKTLFSYLERCRTADRQNLAWRARLINDDLVDLDALLQP
jgi:hypothetical protein